LYAPRAGQQLAGSFLLALAPCKRLARKFVGLTSGLGLAKSAAAAAFTDRERSEDPDEVAALPKEYERGARIAFGQSAACFALAL
jgi:hypothetical protein